jgi:hypothetical protein
VEARGDTELHINAELRHTASKLLYSRSSFSLRSVLGGETSSSSALYCYYAQGYQPILNCDATTKIAVDHENETSMEDDVKCELSTATSTTDLSDDVEDEETLSKAHTKKKCCFATIPFFNLKVFFKSLRIFRRLDDNRRPVMLASNQTCLLMHIDQPYQLH